MQLAKCIWRGRYLPTFLLAFLGLGIFVAAFRVVQHSEWSMLAGGVGFTALLAAYVLVMADRTKQIKQIIQQRTQELQGSEQRMHKMADAAHDAIVMLDQNGCVTFWNAAASRMFGYEAEEILGNCIHDLLVPHDYREKYLQGLQEFLRNGESSRILEFRGIRCNGEEFPVEMSVSVVSVDDRLNVISVLRDITERKHAEELIQRHADILESTNKALESANAAAEAAARAKSEFLANMSHEIRTPMTAILGFADILAESTADSALIEAVNTIKRNGKYLLTMIDDILDLSDIEAEKLSLEKKPCSFLGIVAEVASMMRVRAENHHLNFSTEFDPPLPETIKTDPKRLRQILINLVGNAIKFTESGEVHVATRLRKDKERPRLLQFDVTDTGIGMTPEQIQGLFQPFSQVDTSTSRRFGGPGLGLMISKRLSEMLGGSIGVSSVPQHGTTFSVTIDPGPLDNVPMLEDPAGAAMKIKTSRRRGDKPLPKLPYRILLVEDGPDNQRLITFLLHKAGARVAVAENGQEALDKLVLPKTAMEDGEYPQFEHYDVILMDMQMPVLDGYETTRKLRVLGYTGPIIALTAHAMSHDRQRCLDAGCDDYLSKPVERYDLLEMIAHYASRHGSTDHPRPTLVSA